MKAGSPGESDKDRKRLKHSCFDRRGRRERKKWMNRKYFWKIVKKEDKNG